MEKLIPRNERELLLHITKDDKYNLQFKYLG